MAQKSRTELQGLFKTGAKPSQQDFADFIESTLNIKDDGVEKPSGADNSLKIKAQGTDEKLLDFYAGEVKTWSINQKPQPERIGLNISNSGVSRLFINSSNGNVGIGTTNPGAKLEISGDFKLQNGVAVNRISNDGTLTENSDLTIPTEKAIKIYADTKALLTGSSTQDFETKNLTVNGNFKLQQGLTINTISNDGTLAGNSDLAIPTEKAIKTYVDTKASLAGSSSQDFQTKNLTVTGSLSVAASVGSMTNIDLSGHIQLKEYGQENFAYFQARDDLSNRDIALRIRTQKKGNSKPSIVDAITINSEGNVGIGTGTTIPGAKLEVKGDLKLQNGVAVNNISSDGTFTGNSDLTIPTEKAIKTYVDTKAPLAGSSNQDFQTKSLTVNGGMTVATDKTVRFELGSDKKLSLGGDGSFEIDAPGVAAGRFVVTQEGNVGIGVTDPKQKLVVKGNFNAGKQDESKILNGGNLSIISNAPQIDFIDTDNNDWSIHVNNNKMYFIREPWEHNDLVLDGSGNVGIGTNTPGAKLEVRDTFKVSSDLNEFKISLYASGVIFEIKNSTQGGNNSNRKIVWDGDNNWDLQSDLRLKTDIENESNILSRLMQLEVKNYRWKDDLHAPTKKIGFIAQDVQPLFPYLVGEMKDQENDEKTLTLKYGVFSVLAVGALRELKQEKDAEINALKIQIQELKNLMLMK